MAEVQLFLPGEVVKKSNALARAKWPVSSVWEPRLVALVACRVRQEDEDFHEYEIPIQEIVMEKQDGQTYKRVADVVDNLMGRVVTIHDKANKKVWTKYTLFSKCRLDTERNVLVARFDPDMKQHYLALSKHFTQYNLIEFLKLQSTYSQKLFELLKSWSNVPEFTIGIDDLKDCLGVPETLSRYPDFRRFVLEKSFNDIIKNTALRYEWEPIKNGKRVASIKFIFSKKRLSINNKKDALNQEKQSKERNALFLAATQCKLSGTCNYNENVEKCQICKRLNT